MAKPGRNDPCHCGSGKKYKKCCQPKDDDAERQVIALAQAAREERAEARRAQLAEERALDEEFQELVNTSNAATDLVRAGRLEEAETLARDLLERFPHVHDGWDRLGMVHEARGENKQAADCYRKAIEIIRAEPEMYDPQFADVFVKLVDKLDPPGAAQTTE
jgi:tetratricopeptide (TPR) repeat protein